MLPPVSLVLALGPKTAAGGARRVLGTDIIVALAGIGERHTLRHEIAAKIGPGRVAADRGYHPRPIERHPARDAPAAAEPRRQELARHFAAGLGRAPRANAALARLGQPHAEE